MINKVFLSGYLGESIERSASRIKMVTDSLPDMAKDASCDGEASPWS